jgi:hypothetical protein
MKAGTLTNTGTLTNDGDAFPVLDERYLPGGHKAI